MNNLYKILSEIPSKKRPIIAIFMAIITSAAWYFLSIQPLKTQILSDARMANQIRIKLKQEPKTLERIANLERNIEAQKERKIRLRQQLPHGEDIAKLLKKIDERAKDTNLQITRFERGPTKIQELYARIEIKMEFIGSFSKIINFINELSDAKELDRIINIEELILMRSANFEHAELKGSCLLVTFMSKTNLEPI